METYKLVSNDELHHHGIFGQRWGVRNGPPYPLDDEDHSARERKAGWKASLNNSGKTSSKKEKIVNTSTNKKRKSVSFKQAHQMAKDSKESYKKNEKNKGLTDEQRKQIRNVVLASVGAIGVSAGVYFAIKHHAVSEYKKEMMRWGMQPAQNAAQKAKERMKDAIIEALDESTLVLKSGQILHRQSGFDNYDPKREKLLTYVTTNVKDTMKYMWALKDTAGTGKRYDVSLKVLKDIKIPTDKKALEIFETLWNDKSNGYAERLVNELYDFYMNATAKAFGVQVSQFTKADKQAIKNQILDAITQDPFKQMSTAMAHRGEATKQYFGELTKRGYNAIKDYHDIFDKMADNPLIILDPGNTLQNVGQKLVDDSMRMDAIQKTRGNAYGSNPFYTWTWSAPVNELKKKLGKMIKI